MPGNDIDTIKETRTTPDPSNATLVSIASAAKSERDYVDGKLQVLVTRLNAMDEATKVLSDNVNRTPTLLQTAIKSFGELQDEKFRSIDEKLTAAESMRLEQKQDSKTGLDAALAAQKEAAGTQDVNNQKAIDKSEKATAEIIKNNQDANKTTTDNLTKSLDEVKLAITKLEANKLGVQETRAETRSDTNTRLNATTLGIYILLAVTAVVSVLVAIFKP